MRSLVSLLALGFVATIPLGAQTGKHFMWKVEDSSGSVAYLLGSLHVMTQDAYPLADPINKAFTDSKTLVEEVNIDETSDPTLMMAALAKAMLTDGRTLDQVVSAATYAEVKRRAQEAGMPMVALNRMKPWLVAVTLMAPTLQKSGFKPELGIDQHFFDRAKLSDMKLEALETLAYQLDRFDQLPPNLQEDLLKTTMEDLDTEVNGVKEMAQAWTFGNTAAIEKLTLTALQESPELYRRLLVERNTNWVPHIEACLQEKKACFIVVGAAHLVGPDGLPTLLTKKGYTVTQQ